MNATDLSLIMLGIIIFLLLSFNVSHFLLYRLEKGRRPVSDIRTGYNYMPLKRHFYKSKMYDDIYYVITRLEMKNNIVLTDEAKQLLILPIIEAQIINERNRFISIGEGQWFKTRFESWRESVEVLMDYIKNNPARIDIENERLDERTSISVIKAFAEKFCNIPPFCGEK